MRNFCYKTTGCGGYCYVHPFECFVFSKGSVIKTDNLQFFYGVSPGWSTVELEEWCAPVDDFRKAGACSNRGWESFSEMPLME